MPKCTWKRALLAGGFVLFVLSGSNAHATGRPYMPELQARWLPLAFQQDYFSIWKDVHSSAAQAAQAEPLLQPELAAAEMAALLVQATTLSVPDRAAIAATAAAAPTAAPKATPAKSAPAQPKQKPKAAVASSAAPAAKKAPAAKSEAVAVAGKKVEPKKTIEAQASAYTGSATENGGFGAVDYFGNPLKVGTIAVDPDVIPLGSTVYVTGYRYDGLPEGGMVAKAVDTGSAIQNNRIDIYVPGSPDEARTFGFQNVTVYVLE
ncbi:3D domain-containing protein [Paenibacillus flagellatus]|uniref:3D domain-containing protein n=1 Tax=Paenibacillus flagellatus TaxID=2211139 RepID=A0A2V5K1J9_9BACL|nr:3D domain-containing protein [Paenibacillus flagellatus]PYI51393.1 hypothetical protein DLM86_25580 [Paenibacillus flagellatus]